MTLKVDLWDLGAGLGVILAGVGLGLIAWPLILVAVGAGLFGFSIWGAKNWASSAPS